MNIRIRIKDKNRAKKLMEFLKELPYVEFPSEPKKTKTKKEFKELFGIWRDKDVTIEKIREKAWKRHI